MERYYTAELNQEVLEVEIDGAIYQGSASDFIGYVKSFNPSSILININSYGGSVFDAFAIHDYVKSLSIPTTAHINGIAASAATIIASGCNKITASENSFWLVHFAMDLNGGNRAELERSLRELERIDDRQVKLFEAKTGLSEEFIRELMGKDEMISAVEAHNLGFIDELTPALAIAASLDRELGAEKLYEIYKTSNNMNNDELKEVTGMFDTLKNKFVALFDKEQPTDELTEAINKVAELKGVEASVIVAQLEQTADTTIIDELKAGIEALQAKIDALEVVEEEVEEANVVAELTAKYEASETRFNELMAKVEALEKSTIGTPLEEREVPTAERKVNFKGEKGKDWTIADIKKQLNK